MSKQVFAAGTVCWRKTGWPAGDPQILVLLIHRTKQKDVSFPKGKLDPGESMPQAAVRETHEETGLRVALGANLGTISYELSGGGSKTVQYWAARVKPEAALASTFKPNGEIQALEWVPLEKARKKLTYKADKELFDVFLRMVEHDIHDTFSVTLLRHAQAAPRENLKMPDRDRPLTEQGTAQAKALVPILSCWGPRRIYASSAKRCVKTVTPLARELELPIRDKTQMSQDFWDLGDLAKLRTFVGKVAAKGRNAILCSHRPVLPDLARELSLATGSVPGDYLSEAAALPPAGFSVFYLVRGRPGAGIVSVETYPLGK